MLTGEQRTAKCIQSKGPVKRRRNWSAPSIGSLSATAPCASGREMSRPGFHPRILGLGWAAARIRPADLRKPRIRGWKPVRFRTWSPGPNPAPGNNATAKAVGVMPALSDSATDFKSADCHAYVLSVGGGIISCVLVMTSRIVQVHQDPTQTHANGAIRGLMPGASMALERRGELPDGRNIQARQRLGWATHVPPRPRRRRPMLTSVPTNARGARVPRSRQHGASICQISDVGKIWGSSESKSGSRRQGSAENGGGSQHNARWVPVTY